MRILVIDVGGTHIKLLATGQTEPIKIPSGRQMTAAHMVRLVQKTVAGWKYDAVSIGYPGPVVHGRPVSEPRNLGGGWVGFDFETAFGRPVKVLNDAAMQALGSYSGGKMLFLGLGTGLGSALIVNNIVAPLELAHLPYRKGTYEDYVGNPALLRFGMKKWRKNVTDVVDRLRAAIQPDEIVLGGGNTKKLKELPPGCRMGSNADAFPGGFRLWSDVLSSQSSPVEKSATG